MKCIKYSSLEKIPLGVLNVGNGAKRYMASRAAATALSLTFSIYYSNLLGPTNRGFITVIMTFSILVITILMGGTTLTARKIGSHKLNQELRKSLKSLVTLQALVGLFVFLVLIHSYSKFKEEIPIALIIAAVLYFLSSALHFFSLEWRIVNNLFTSAGVAEVVTIVTQLVIFAILINLEVFSSAVALLFSLSFAYLLIGLWGFKEMNLPILAKESFGHPNLFYSQTRGFHLIGIALSIMDRLDRLTISIIYSTSQLAQYAAMSGILTIFRFIPDALSKLAVSGIKLVNRATKWRHFYYFIIIPLGVYIIVIFVRYFISLALGKEWLLPISTFLIFSLCEISRGSFQIQANKHANSGKEKLSHRSTIIVVRYVVVVLPLSVIFFGLNGVPVGIGISYLLGLLHLVRVKYVNS